MTKVAINGFGRIGRTVLRLLAKRESSLEVVAINDLTSPATLAHLFKYDSVHGPYEGVTLDGDVLKVGRHNAKIFAVKNPAELPLPREGPAAPDRRREEGPHLGPGREGRPHVRHGRQRAPV